MAYRHSGYRSGSGSGSRHPESHEPKAENVSQYVVRRISAPPAQRPAPPAPRPQRQLIDTIHHRRTGVAYEIYSPRLGDGEFGVVRPCRSSKDGWIAVKVVPKEKEELQLKEVHALEKLKLKGERHMNIIRYFSTFEDSAYIYFMFELAEGGDLHGKMASSIMSEEQKKVVLWQVLSGVKFLHKHKLVHRDLKPNNILFSRPGTLDVRIIDFGGAEWVDEYEGQVAKEVRYIVGTREYLSPEHLKYLATPKMDVWSIGVILWKMFQGLHSNPIRVPQFEQTNPREDREAFRARRAAAHEAECRRLSNSSVWAAWRGPSGAMKLCKRMLEADIDLRISASEALRHDWLSQ